MCWKLWYTQYGNLYGNRLGAVELIVVFCISLFSWGVHPASYFTDRKCNGSINERTVRCACAAKPIRLSSLIYKNLKLRKKRERKRAGGPYIQKAITCWAHAGPVLGPCRGPYRGRNRKWTHFRYGVQSHLDGPYGLPVQSNRMYR